MFKGIQKIVRLWKQLGPEWKSGIYLFFNLALISYWLVQCYTPSPPTGAGEWEIYKKRFLTESGRIVDTGNQNISHSEGQGYGMLLAVHYNDQAAFEKMRWWTFHHLQVREDGLLAWRWNPKTHRVDDLNNATDGDILVAWALNRASIQWAKPEYFQQSSQLSLAILDNLVYPSDYGPVLLPGKDGFVKNGVPVVNLSYWIFPAFPILDDTYHLGLWQEISKTGRQLLDAAKFGKWGLPPDWLLLSQPLQPAPDFAAEFGYNAMRIPLHLLWHWPHDTERTKAFHEFWSSFPFWKPEAVSFRDNHPKIYSSSKSVRAVSHWVEAVQKGENILPKKLGRLTSREDYYTASLLLLTKMALKENLKR